MQKLQILFPDDMMDWLRQVAKAEERPVSEIVRRAIEEFGRHYPNDKMKKTKLEDLVFEGGEILVSGEKLREIVYEDRFA